MGRAGAACAHPPRSRHLPARFVLTLNRKYRRLQEPLERRILELVRKHCGRKADWWMSVATLHVKFGSGSPLRVFSQFLHEMFQTNHLPDCARANGLDDIMLVTCRVRVLEPGEGPALKTSTLDRARDLIPGTDVHALAAEWQAAWARTGCQALRAPDLVFLGSVRRQRPGSPG